MLHGVLLRGATLFTAALLIMVAVSGPLLGGDPDAGLIGSIMGGLGLIAALVAVLALRPRVPARRSGQSADEFWDAADNRTRALLVWVVAEAGTITWGIGYLLSGSLLPLGGAAIGLGVLFLTRPSALSPP